MVTTPDDGFRTTSGNPLDAFGAITLGEFNGSRGASDTLFSFVVQEAGVYAFRTVWFAGADGANLEWFTVKADGSKALVNDSANGGVKAYRALAAGTQPVIKSVSPTHVNVIARVASTNLVITIQDGTNPVNENSIVLKIDGEIVNTTKSRAGNLVTVTYNPTTLRMPYEAYNAELTFSNAAGNYTRTQEWTFRNLKNLILPTPVLTENFDSYTEGETEPVLPTRWIATNYTTTVTEGLDRDDLRSDYYKGWVVMTRERLEGLKARIFNLLPGQMVNGQEVTALSEGNMLYAESDVRGGNQILFIESKPFDLSNVTNVIMSF